jgi:hypothetical protein
MKSKNVLVAMLVLIAGFTSCKKEEKDTSSVSKDYSHGVLITNEGPYSSGTGTVTHFDSNNKNVSQNVFEDVNGFPLGNLVQSITVAGDKTYIVVNNAQKIEVVNSTSFSSVGTITALEQPRYFLGVNASKGYVTQWGDGSRGELKVVDLNSRTITKTIDIGKGSDRMLLSDNYVFVCNAGGYNPSTYDPVNDSSISVIDIANDNLIQRINVGYNPAGIVKDMYGKLWVICDGINDYNIPANDRPGCLARINPSTFSVELTLPFSANDLETRIAIDNDGYNIYYQYSGSVYKMSVTATTLPATPFINRTFYAFGYDPSTHYIYGSDAGNFSSNGYAIRYQESGVVVDSFMVGIGPGNFAFQPQ